LQRLHNHLVAGSLPPFISARHFWRGLGIDIVAEGVETEFEAVMMTHFGCTELQGYYFSRPISADQMTQLLRTFQPKRPASAPAAVCAATTS
jgi:predicted signal transduction protein with EAL and GGDEF domain